VAWEAQSSLLSVKIDMNIRGTTPQGAPPQKFPGSHVLNLGLLPPQDNPFLTPHNYKKGVNLLRMWAVICLHNSHAKLINTWRVIGLELINCTLLHWPPVKCTNSAKTFAKALFTSFMQLLCNVIRELQVRGQLLVFCLNTPWRPTWGHSMHFCDQAPRPLIKSPNMGANQLGSSWEFQKYINHFAKAAQ